MGARAALHRQGAALSLLVAVATWFAAAFLLWFLVYGRDRRGAVKRGVG